MANLRKVARQDARRYGLDKIAPGAFERQIGAESGYNPHAVSPAGARGVAQIMPGTAAGWGINPDDPIASLDAAAKHMAQYVKQFGSYRNALVAYNAGPGRVGGKLPAETVNYISKILGGSAKGQRSATGGTPAISGTRYTPATTKTDEAGAAVDALLAHAKSPGSSLLQGFVRNLDSGLYTTHTPASKTTYSLPGVTGPPAPSSHIKGGHSAVTFDGKPVVGWIAGILKQARATGIWKGSVSSGVRSKAGQLKAAQGYGLQHYPNGPLASNHVEGHDGAVDVSDPEGLKRALAKLGITDLKSSMPEDPVHFSRTGH